MGQRAWLGLALCVGLCVACRTPPLSGEAGPTGDGSPSDGAVGDFALGVNTCQTLTLTFVGCDEERLYECVREYDAVSPAHRQLVDDAVACLRASHPDIAGAEWPVNGAACSARAVPPLHSANQLWDHGGCQNVTVKVGETGTGITSDPAFPDCSLPDPGKTPGCGPRNVGSPVCFFASNDQSYCGANL
jgi:hypothetical protein